MVRDGDSIYTYDERGNLKSKEDKDTKEITLYLFNLFNQLVKVIKQDKEQNPIEVLEYTYDALNRRVSRSISKKENNQLKKFTHHYLYDEHNIVAILDHDKELLATIVHDKEIDTPLSITTHQNEARELTKAEAYHYEEFDEETKAFVEKQRKNRTYYYHRDHQGSIIKLTDEQGVTVERFVYDAYGKILEHKQTQTTLNPYCYTGREFDGEGMYDLYYYRARYYDPTQGRFISQDPIEFMAGDFNFYRYVGNSPVNFRDPSGLCPPCAAIAINALRIAAIKYGPKIAKAIIKEIKEQIKDEVVDATKGEINEAVNQAVGQLGIVVRGTKAISACGDKAKHKKSKKRRLANNGKKGKDKLKFHRDHMPADSVMQARARAVAKNNGKKNCDKAIKAIRGNAETIMLPDFIHIDGRTFGSKVKPLMHSDKNHLGKAAKDDIQAARDATERALKQKCVKIM